jgi:O-methyltransferase
MIKKIYNLVLSILKFNVVLDYRLIGLNRKRLFKIPHITNYIRISNFELIVNEIIDGNVKGNVAELGVYKGEFSKYINLAFPDRKFYLFDTFEGFDEKDVVIEKGNEFSSGEQDFTNTSIGEVISKMPFKENCIIKQGYFPDSLQGLEDTFCFVSIDPDLYKPILDGLEYFYPRLNKGGYILVHDYNNDSYSGAKKAVREYCHKNNIPFTPLTDAWGTVVIAK